MYSKVVLAIICLCFTLDSHSFDLSDFAKRLKVEIAEYKDENSKQNAQQNVISSNENQKLPGTDQRPYEVDGIAVGDDVNDVLKKLGFTRSDLAVEEEFTYIFNRQEIAKNDVDKALEEWNLIRPKNLVLDLGRDKNFDKFKFNHHGKLTDFQITKVYNKKLTSSQLEEKVIAKYGKTRRNSNGRKVWLLYMNAPTNSLQLQVDIRNEKENEWVLVFYGYQSPPYLQKNREDFIREGQAQFAILKKKYPVKFDKVDDIKF